MREFIHGNQIAVRGGIPAPKLYLILEDAPNAFATGRNPAHSSLAVTEGLLQKASGLILENAGEEGAKNQTIKALAARMGKQITQMQLSQAAEYQADSLSPSNSCLGKSGWKRRTAFSTLR